MGKAVKAATRGGLHGGARGDGDSATLANIRIRKITHSIHGTGLTVRELLCHGRTQDGQLHAYEVTFQDSPNRRVSTDLVPRLQIDSDRDFPDVSMPQLQGQWQIIGHPSLGGMDVCPHCFWSCSEMTCPICGRSPLSDSKSVLRSASRRLLGALDVGGASERSGEINLGPALPMAPPASPIVHVAPGCSSGLHLGLSQL